MEKLFTGYAMTAENPKYPDAILREKPLFNHDGDLRSPFFRDYTRVIHCSAFRRLKHKTQVFFSPQSDHICTRIEHVLHVESISSTIADTLGLNGELVRSIAIAHDIGHPPFGHKGEKVLSEIYEKTLGEKFWHEKNSLWVLDRLELLENAEREQKNLFLTYAVRDGVICHCGEAAHKALLPRKDACDLCTFQKPGEKEPFTFEGCVVRMADKISYVGRDIEDAITIGILDDRKKKELFEIVGDFTGKKINNTITISHLISDLCASSDPEHGIRFSDPGSEFLDILSDFNVKNIYQCPRVLRADSFFSLVINQIFDLLFGCFGGEKTLENLNTLSKQHPELSRMFIEWLASFWTEKREPNFKNAPLFDIGDEKSYARAVLSYISGMSDRFAIDCYNEIISF